MKSSLGQRVFYINRIEPYGKAVVPGPYLMGAERMAKSWGWVSGSLSEIWTL